MFIMQTAGFLSQLRSFFINIAVTYGSEPLTRLSP